MIYRHGGTTSSNGNTEARDDSMRPCGRCRSAFHIFTCECPCHNLATLLTELDGERIRTQLAYERENRKAI